MKGVGRLLDDPVAEERVHRLWQGTRGRMRRAERRRVAVKVGAAVSALALAVSAGVWSTRGPVILRLEDGSAPVALRAADAARGVTMDDGSRIEVAAQGRWIPTANVEGRFESEVEEGRVRFEVTPGGPRAWVVRAGSTVVEVVGTRFTVTREGDAVAVEVERGRVRVRDPRLEAGERLLTAGEEVRLGWPAPVAVEAPVTETPAPEPSRAEPTAAPSPAPRPAPPARVVRDAPAEDWRALARTGAHDEAFDAIGAEGIRRETSQANAGQLLLLADVARLSGHPEEAVGPLERLLAEHPDAPGSPLAAITLGRIEMDALHRPARARRAFERALSLGVPDALRGDVERRLEILAP